MDTIATGLSRWWMQALWWMLGRSLCPLSISGSVWAASSPAPAHSILLKHWNEWAHTDPLTDFYTLKALTGKLGRAVGLLLSSPAVWPYFFPSFTPWLFVVGWRFCPAPSPCRDRWAPELAVAMLVRCVCAYHMAYHGLSCPGWPHSAQKLWKDDKSVSSGNVPIICHCRRFWFSFKTQPNELRNLSS